MLCVPTALMLLFLLVSSRGLQQGSGFITRAPEFRADSGQQAQSVRSYSACSSQKTEAWVFGGFDISSSKETR